MKDKGNLDNIKLLVGGIVILCIGVYTKVYIPNQEYFDSGQLLWDILKYSGATIGVIVLGFLIFLAIRGYIRRKKRIAHERKRAKRKKEEKERKEKELKERLKSEEEKRKQREEETRKKRALELIEEKQRKREERQFWKQVNELVDFKRKFGVKVLPADEHYPDKVIEKARSVLRREFREKQRLEEIRGEAIEYYSKYDRSTIPESWDRLDDEGREIWEEVRTSKRLSKKSKESDKDSERLKKALEELE